MPEVLPMERKMSKATAFLNWEHRSKRDSVELTCDYCKTKFRRKLSHVPKENAFCSKAHHVAYWSENRKYKDHNDEVRQRYAAYQDAWVGNERTHPARYKERFLVTLKSLGFAKVIVRLDINQQGIAFEATHPDKDRVIVWGSSGWKPPVPKQSSVALEENKRFFMLHVSPADEKRCHLSEVNLGKVKPGNPVYVPVQSIYKAQS